VKLGKEQLAGQIVITALLKKGTLSITLIISYIVLSMITVL